MAGERASLERVRLVVFFLLGNFRYTGVCVALGTSDQMDVEGRSRLSPLNFERTFLSIRGY